MSRSSEESIGGSESEPTPDSRPSEHGEGAAETRSGRIRNPDTNAPERELPSRAEQERGESIERVDHDVNGSE